MESPIIKKNEPGAENLLHYNLRELTSAFSTPQSLPNGFWGKLDAKIPIEWANDNAVPATTEVQLGKMFSPAFGVYVDALVGIGVDKPYEWGGGVGLRFNY